MEPIVRRLLEKFRTATERGFYSVKNKDNIGNNVRQVKKLMNNQNQKKSCLYARKWCLGRLYVHREKDRERQNIFN